MDASVFLEWVAQHQYTLLKKSEAKRAILAFLNSSIKSFRTTQRNIPPPCTGNWNSNSLWAKFTLAYCWAFWTYWGSHLESSDDVCWISERTGCFFLPSRWGWCASLPPLITSPDCSSSFLFMRWQGEFWLCPPWKAWWETGLLHQHEFCCATVKSWCEFSKKVYDEEIHGCKFYLSDVLHCAWHIPDIFFEYFLHLPHTHFPSAQYLHSGTTSEEHGSWNTS